MGLFTDIAEIAGLLFATYMAGWLIGYATHRLTARSPVLDIAGASQGAVAAAQQPDDALVKAPVVVPVAGATPQQVLAAASAIEPVKATAVPDADEVAPAAAAPAVAPVASALETLKSLSTAMPLLPVDVRPPMAATAPQAEVEASSADSAIPAPQAEGIEPSMTAEKAEPVVAAPPIEIVVPPQSEEAGTGRPLPPPGLAGAAEISAPKELATRVAPAARAGETTALPIEPVLPPQPEPVPEPPAAAAPIPALPPMPASAPGMPWTGAIKGRDAHKFEPEANSEAAAGAAPTQSGEPIAEPDAALDVALLSSIADGLKLDQAPPAAPEAATSAAISAEPPAESEFARPEDVAAVPSPDKPIEPLPIVPEPAAVQPVEPAPPPRSRRPALDEDAAMRDIEGGWSRRDVRALRDAPELTDVTAAVSAAQVAVEQVLARNGVDAAEPDSRAQSVFGKPAGLPQPRDGRRDSLRRIDGLGPLDEVTLNNLGIYHFDQIARWSEREVLWLENHAFAVGRIGRESWQDQARELLAGRDATRALR